ncbi:MAG: right-handed parallel beta-helix repeat-containing protein, partial [Phycisphaerales bacterium]|nr:right-handed parallel beta-helix repeat-containing protein [Phycisphaerales bacterium]
IIHIGTPVLYVNGLAVGANDGTSWTNAYRNLQDALAYASTDPTVDEIWVASGSYNPDRGVGITPGDRTASFNLQIGVALYGGFNGTETLLSQRNPALNTTILSGDLTGDDAPVACIQNSPDCDSFGGLCRNGSCIISNNNAENSYHVVTGSFTDASSILDGFTITAGMAEAPQGGAGLLNNSGSPTVTNCTFSGNSAYTGGGMANNGDSNPIVTNCTFSGNSGGLLIFGGGGGGIYNANNSSPTITNCTFSGNSAVEVGGGIVNNSGSPTVTNCTFSGNLAVQSGGGMYNFASNPAVTNCTFSGNSTTGAFLGTGGGGMRNQGGNPTITNCTFSGNNASSLGGGMFNDSDPTVINCTFSGNSALSDGGGMYNLNSSPTVINCSFTGNSSLSSGGGMYNGNSSPTVVNSILWSNSDPGGMDESAQIHTASGVPVVNYSIVLGGWSGAGGTGVVNADPLFFDPDGADNIVGTIDDDLRLRAGSPAIDAGDSTAMPLDVLDLDGDTDTSEPIPIDLSDNGRVVDDPMTADSGVPSPGICDGNGGPPLGTPCVSDANCTPGTCLCSGPCGVVDMGAYEYFPDCNNNGIDDATDIAGPSEDCNSTDWPSNGFPDECDIAACSANPACDDCNLNGVPDACDIGSGFSLDVAPTDGVPDECVNFTALCSPPTDEWSCFDNW